MVFDIQEKAGCVPGFQTVEKGKEIKKKSPGKKLAVAKPCIFAQQSASHAANAAKKGW